MTPTTKPDLLEKLVNVATIVNGLAKRICTRDDAGFRIRQDALLIEKTMNRLVEEMRETLRPETEKEHV